MEFSKFSLCRNFYLDCVYANDLKGSFWLFDGFFWRWKGKRYRNSGGNERENLFNNIRGEGFISMDEFRWEDW